MATATATLSTAELQRIGAASYEGKTLYAALCYAGTNSTATVNSTVSTWQALELSGNGYTRYSVTIPTGSYSSTDNLYQIGSAGAGTYLSATFTASSAGSLTFDRVAIWITGQTYLVSLITESETVVIAPGQSQTVKLQLAVGSL